MRKVKSLFHSANHAINYCARSIAKNAVKEQLSAAGVRVTLVKAAEIAERAKVYLEQHPELYQQALERARQLGYVELLPPVRTNRGLLLNVSHAQNGAWNDDDWICPRVY